MQKPHKCLCNQVTKSRSLFGKVARITVVGKGENCANKIISSAFGVLERFEGITDPVKLRYEFLKLSHSALGQYHPVSMWLWHLLQVSNDISYRTDGLFDVAAAGTDGTREWTDIDLSERGKVLLRRPLKVSVGGIRKGFAVDLAVKALKELGADSGLVDIGGCIRTFGNREWRVEFRPVSTGGMNTETVIPVALNNSALAGLGAYFGGSTLYDYENNIVHSTEEWQEASLLVRAGSCALADALTKIAALRPSDSKKLLIQFGATAVKLSEQGVAQLVPQ